MKKRKARQHTHRIKSLTAWVGALALTVGAVAVGVGLGKRFPAFDPLPLFGILSAAFAVACIVNRLSAKAFARRHFGMSFDELATFMNNHDKACKENPEAVLKSYTGMAVIPVFLLAVYVSLTLSLIVTGGMCATVTDGGRWYFVARWMGIVLGSFLIYMPLYRILDVIPPRLQKDTLIPDEKLPLLGDMARRAAHAAGVKGKIRFEITCECECDVNRFGNTYVVFLGTRLMAVLPPDEMEQALILAFSAFSCPRLNRQVLFRYRLGLLGGAKIRPATFAFDLFFSYADAALEWEYDLYSRAVKRLLIREGYQRVRGQGGTQGALGVLAKKAFWHYYVFELTDFVSDSYYLSPIPSTEHEQKICRGFRAACECRHGAWLSLLEKVSEENAPPEVLFCAERAILDPDGVASLRILLPDDDSAYGEEINRLMADGEIFGIPSEADEGYRKAREREYLEPLRIVEEYEKDPTGYSTPELSPVINGYRDIGQLRRAEALCDEILEREHNPFAMAHAMYFKGLCMLHRYETEGIDLVYRAIDLNKNYMQNGFEVVEEYCVLCGLTDEYATFRRRAEAQMSAHAYNQEGASYLRVTDRLEPEEGLGDMLPDILAYMERVSDGCLREVYLVRKVISEDFFSSVFVINFDYGVPEEKMRKTYESIFNYLDAYPVDWQFSLFVYDRDTERAVMRIEGSRVWTKQDKS